MQTCIARFWVSFFPLINAASFLATPVSRRVSEFRSHTLVRPHWHAAAFDVYTTRIASIGGYLPAAETSQANHAHWFFPQLSSAIWAGAFRCSAGNDLDAFQPKERHKSPCEELGLVIDGDTRQDTCPTSRSLQLAQISSKIYCSCFSFRVDMYPHLASSRRGLTRQKTNTSLDFWCGNLVYKMWSNSFFPALSHCDVKYKR